MTSLTRGYCQTEHRETRWSFAGYATASAAENTIRPRAFHQSCSSCKSLVLTLGYAVPGYVHDADGLAKAVLKEWLRKAGGAADKIDVENVLGDLRLHVWHLYNKWVPGGVTFTSYATGILRRKINTFVARDVGDPLDRTRGRRPKAHSRTHATSYENLVREDDAAAGGGERGGLDFALGLVEVDGTAGRYAAFSWVDSVRGVSGDGIVGQPSGSTLGSTTT